MRIVPKAGEVVFVNVDDVPSLWALVEVRVKQELFGNYQSNLYLKACNSRVLVYVERSASPYALCLTKPAKGHSLGMNTRDGRVTSAGTGGAYDWLMIEPVYHPDYDKVLNEYKARKGKEEAARAKREEENEEKASQIEELINKLGYDEALRRLQA